MTWIAALSAVIAVAAAAHAWRSVLRLGAAGAPIGRADALRPRAPALLVAVLDADIRLGLADGSCQYALLVSVTNGSAIARTFTAIDLRIRYRTASNFTGAVEAPMTAAADPGGSRTGEVALRLPLTVAAQQVTIGWANFVSGDVVPRDGSADGYTVVLTGNAGELLTAEVAASTIRRPQSLSATQPA